MSTPIFGFAERAPDADSRKAKILDILSRGNIVVFTGRNAVKKVKEWNADSDGDLIAYESTGMVPYVCWDAADYTISEETPNGQ